MLTIEEIAKLRADPEDIHPAVIYSLCDMALKYLAMQPRPIAEAPKDGPWVLSYGRNPVNQKP